MQNLFKNLVCASALCLAIQAAPAAEVTHFTVTTNLLAPEPISPRLYGNFIELGYGVQVEPMWGEMFFNRSFEPFRPYKDINVEWFDLWNDPKDHAKGYKTDWSHEDWYHTGYEHNPWFAAPGDDGLLPIDHQSTFIVEKTPLARVEVRPVPGGSGHGVRSLIVSNHDSEKWGGLGQGGKLLRAGAGYTFRGKFRSLKSPVNAEIRFYPRGHWDTPIARLPLAEIGTNWGERSVSFTNQSFAGWAVFALWLPPGAEVQVDDFSLMPEQTFYGWRPEVVAALRAVKPGIIRFPGGCFASFYNWRDAIGPFSQRRPGDSFFWGGQNYNDVGVAEFATLCRMVGSEMMFCANVYHPSKQKYAVDWGRHIGQGPHGYDFTNFTSVTQGAKDHADLVAYCNLPAGSNPLANLRAQQGYPNPLGVKYWEMDNEVHRWFEPEEYARAVVVYAKAMKAVDPTIKIGLVTYGYRLEKEPPHKERDNFHDHVQSMLEIAGPYVDFLADRGPSDKAYLDRLLGILRDYNAKHGTDIKYCETEKLFDDGQPNAENVVAPSGGFTRSFMFSKWYYALNVFREYLAYQRAGGEVDFVIFNNLANTHSQSVIETPKENAYLSAAGIAMSTLAHSAAAWPLKLDGYAVKTTNQFVVQAAWTLDRQGLVLTVLNRTATTQPVTIDLGRLGRTFHSTDFLTLTADDPLAMNTLAHPDAIRRVTRQLHDLKLNRELQVNSAAYSYVQITLE